MLVNSSVLDCVSLGTNDDSHSEIFVPRPDEDDDDWGIVSVDGDDEQGEIILDGVEEKEEDDDDYGKEPELTTEKSHDEGSQLSVPSVLGSIEDLVFSQSKEINKEGVDGQFQTEATTTPSAGASAANHNNQNTSNRLVFFLVVPALLLVPTIASVYLYKERNNLQNSVLELEDAVSSLHLEAEQRKLEEELLWEDKEFLQLSSRELQEKVIQLKKETDGNKIQQEQLEYLHKERSTLKLYILHLQDKVNSLKKKAAQEKRQGDALFQDKKFLEWSSATLQEKLQKLKVEAAQKEQEERQRLEALHQEKASLEGMVKQFQDEISRVKRESDRKLREEELRWNSLFQEKISLRVQTAKLEDQVVTLKKKARISRKEEGPRRAWYRKERDVLLETVAKLEDEVLALREDAERRKNTETLLNLNSCEAEAGELVLFDNCWINARLGNCANEAKNAVGGAIHDLSESFSQWMESYTAAKRTSPRSHAQNNTPLSGEKKNRPVVSIGEKLKVASVGKKLENATTVKNANWNSTSSDAEKSISTSVAKMMRSVDSFGRALWNATAFRMNKHTSGNNQGRSFFSRMDLNGKLWFESFFPASSNRKALILYNSTSNSLDRVFQKVSDIILAASHPDEVMEQASSIFMNTGKNSSMDNAGEAFVASAVTKFCNSVALNQSSKNYLMKAAKQSYKEVSLIHRRSISM